MCVPSARCLAQAIYAGSGATIDRALIHIDAGKLGGIKAPANEAPQK